MQIPDGLSFAQRRFPHTGLIRELCSRAGSGMNQSSYQFVAERLSFNKIDILRRNSTIGVVLLAHVSFCLVVIAVRLHVL